MKTRKELEAFAIKGTDEYRKSLKEKKQSKFSIKALKAQKVINNNDFGCQKDAVLELTSVILGEDITKKEEEETYIKLGMVFMIKPGGSKIIDADCKDGEFYFVFNLLDRDGEFMDYTGNDDYYSIKFGHSNLIKLATHREIGLFFNKVAKKKKITQFIDRLGNV